MEQRCYVPQLKTYNAFTELCCCGKFFMRGLI